MNILDELIRKIEKRFEIYSIVGTISEIDEGKMTAKVTPLNGDPELFGVKLLSSSSGDAQTIFVPVDGSEVTVTFLNAETGFISQISNVEKVLIKSKDEIVIEAGEKVSIKNSSQNLKELFDELFSFLEKDLMVSTPSGPSGPPLPASVSKLATIKNKFGQLLK